jgi:hypothetical protein
VCAGFVFHRGVVPVSSPDLEFVSSGQKGFLLFFAVSLSAPPVLVIAALDFFSIRTPPLFMVLSLAPAHRSRSDRFFCFEILFCGSCRPKHICLPRWVFPAWATIGPRFFFYFGLFNHYSRNEPRETFFPNLALLSHANPFGATYEGVTPVHLAWLKELARARVAMLAGIVPRRISHAS